MFDVTWEVSPCLSPMFGAKAVVRKASMTLHTKPPSFIAPTVSPDLPVGASIHQRVSNFKCEHITVKEAMGGHQTLRITRQE